MAKYWPAYLIRYYQIVATDIGSTLYLRIYIILAIIAPIYIALSYLSLYNKNPASSILT